MNITAKNGLPTNQVGAILEDRDGNLWIGTAAGLCRMSGGKFTTITMRDGLSGDQVVALYEDGEGSLWAGTFGGGLTRIMDGKFMAVTKREKSKSFFATRCTSAAVTAFKKVS